jgi:hypothetical protein
MQARMVFHMPSTAICWSVYEFFKYYITRYRTDIMTNEADARDGHLFPAGGDMPIASANKFAAPM